jgi:ATP-binding cassette subfamily F protein uup
MNFPGCLLIVSHDRYFLDRLVDHLFVFEDNGHIRDFPGNYTDYRNFLAENKESNAGNGKQSNNQSPLGRY